jgi:aryl-alcohol dehydrogenase-like predicted oxidoreductase
MDPLRRRTIGDRFMKATSYIGLTSQTCATYPVAKQGILLDKFDPDHPPQFGDGDIRGGNRAFTRERLLEMRQRLQPLKERFGGEVQDMVRVALQYALARSPSACVIPGFKNARQVESNAQAAGRPLSTEDVAFIRATLQGG